MVLVSELKVHDLNKLSQISLINVFESLNIQVSTNYKDILLHTFYKKTMDNKKCCDLTEKCMVFSERAFVDHRSIECMNIIYSSTNGNVKTP
jgi:hypothetical protein